MFGRARRKRIDRFGLEFLFAALIGGLSFAAPAAAAQVSAQRAAVSPTIPTPKRAAASAAAVVGPLPGRRWLVVATADGGLGTGNGSWRGGGHRGGADRHGARRAGPGPLAAHGLTAVRMA